MLTGDLRHGCFRTKAVCVPSLDIYDHYAQSCCAYRTNMSSPVQAFLAMHPVFTHEEFTAYLAAGRERNPRTNQSLLRHYLKTNRLLRIRRGLYATVPPGMTPEAYSVDPYLLAGKMTHDAVIAYHTALEFYGKAYSVQGRFLFLTESVARPAQFRSYRFRSVSFPRSLRRKKHIVFGVADSETAGVNIRVTSLERTLVDVLDRPDLGGGWEEIWRSLESVEFFNLETIIAYALILGNATMIAKVGFYLDQHRKALMVEDRHLDRLKSHRPKNPHYLVRTQ